MKNQLQEQDYQHLVEVIKKVEKKKSRKETYGKKNTRYKRTGYDIFVNDMINLTPPPYGYNYVLGYCQDTVQQDNSVI